MDLALLFFGFLWALAGGGTRSATSSTSSTSSRPPAPALPPGGAPPWPQVVPPGLPAFPGSGWQFDEPPPPAVQQRAQQLVSALWARGSGTWKTEQTAGRWITYRAEIVASGKKGVVAYRVKPAAAHQPPPLPTRPRPPVPAPNAPMATRPPAPAPASSSPAPPAVAPVSPLSLPVLRFGMGLKPAAPVSEVVLLQQRLGIVADGRFGPGTRTAVIEFQRRTGLAPNETNDALLKRGFGVVKQATWEKLFAVRA